MFNNNNYPNITYSLINAKDQTAIYKINHDGEVLCMKKLYPNSSLEEVRERLKNDIHSDFLFTMKDQTKIMKSDEKVFHIFEISYKEEHMNFLNIITFKSNPIRTEIKPIIENIPQKPQVPEKNTNNIKPAIVDQTILSKDFSAPLPGENSLGSKINKDKLLGKKQKNTGDSKINYNINEEENSDFDSDNESEDELESSDSESDSDSESKGVLEINLKNKKKPAQILDGNINLKSFTIKQLNFMRRSLKNCLMDEIKNICRENGIVHLNKTKPELITQIKKSISFLKKGLRKTHNISYSEFQSLNDKYMKNNKEELKDILINYRLRYSGISKVDMVDSIIEYELKNKK